MFRTANAVESSNEEYPISFSWTIRNDHSV